MLSKSSPDSTVVWHALESDRAVAQLESDRDAGLSAEQARARLERYGPNEIQETGTRSSWAILVDQFKNIMLLMLIAVAIVSLILSVLDEQFPKDAIAILSIVILNGILGYVQESRAEQALAALKNLAAPVVRVVRDARVREVSAKELVPGDIMLLEAGAQVAADGRLLEEQNLQMRESALTGEAQSVDKDARAILAEDAALGDRVNCVFQGTEVVAGRAKAIVTRTGMDSELGRIAAMLQSVEDEETPLQQRMGQLGNVLVTGSLILVAIVVIGGTLANLSSFRNLLEVSLSMAVAVVPEGLPAVITVTLALGTQRMVKRHALIRKLPAVETLGSVTTICSDKTGTLTQNKMVVQRVETLGHRYRVTGEGYDPQGEFKLEDDTEIAQFDESPELQQLLLACVLCNDALLQQERGEWRIIGDPTEGALLSLAGKASLFQEGLKSMWRVGEFPFTSERKRMSVTCETGEWQTETGDWKTATDSPFVLFSKGSPELTLERCTHVQQGDRVEVLTEEARSRILEQNNDMAAQGLRVLGFAYKPLPEIPPEGAEEETERETIWLGLVGMLDAPRPEVRDAVNKCRAAGIRPVMITGDHQLTAKAIAYDLGIAKAGNGESDTFVPNTLRERILTGVELEKMDAAELESWVDTVSVYARVAPEHKLRIVRALQQRGKFVAMTGDGVNDAPALKQADIGIAMGITGTDVSKEASDMVLLDDNFATIVAATEEGRVVYTNIRRFVKYILGSNIGEVLTIASAPILGLHDVPLIPLQILWMNLVTDGLPALALALEPAEPNVMRQPPFSPRESIFARGLGAYMVRIGIIFSIISISLMGWAYQHTHAPGYTGNPDAWKTMVFTTLCIAQMGHAIAVRSNQKLTVELNPFRNPFLLGAVTLTTILQLMLVYIAPLRNFFDTHWLSPLELAVCLAFSVLMFVWVELEKLFVRWYRTRQR